MLAGSLLVFVLALGFYITPALLGSPKDTMLSAFIAPRPAAARLGARERDGVVLIVVTLVVLFLASRVIRLRDVFGARTRSRRWAIPGVSRAASLMAALAC